MVEEINEALPRSLKKNILLISISAMGLAIFWYFEGSFFNTYITHVLGLDYFFVAVMVSLSAIMGLIFVFTFGVLSDNTRTKLGRRRPYLLFGILAGISMILFSFSPNYIWCLIFDVAIIGVAVNAYMAAHNALIPDIILLEHRGRANATFTTFETIANILPLALTMIIYENYTIQTSEGAILNQQGHFILLLFGGLGIISCALITFLFIKEPLKASELPLKKTFREEIRNTFQFSELKRHKEFFKFILATTIFSVGTKMITIYLFNYLFSLGVSTLEFILAFLVLGPTLLLSIFLLGKLSDKLGRKKLIPPVLVLSSIGCILMPYGGTAGSLNVPIIVIGATLVLLGSTALMVPVNAWKQDLLPADKRGQFIGILNITSTANQIPAAFLAAFIADSFGVQWIFSLIPIFFIGSIPFFLKVKETFQIQED